MSTQVQDQKSGVNGERIGMCIKLLEAKFPELKSWNWPVVTKIVSLVSSGTPMTTFFDFFEACNFFYQQLGSITPNAQFMSVILATPPKESARLDIPNRVMELVKPRKDKVLEYIKWQTAQFPQCWTFDINFSSNELVASRTTNDSKQSPSPIVKFQAVLETPIWKEALLEWTDLILHGATTLILPPRLRIQDIPSDLKSYKNAKWLQEGPFDETIDREKLTTVLTLCRPVFEKLYTSIPFSTVMEISNNSHMRRCDPLHMKCLAYIGEVLAVITHPVFLKLKTKVIRAVQKKQHGVMLHLPQSMVDAHRDLYQHDLVNVIMDAVFLGHAEKPSIYKTDFSHLGNLVTIQWDFKGPTAEKASEPQAEDDVWHKEAMDKIVRCIGRGPVTVDIPQEATMVDARTCHKKHAARTKRLMQDLGFSFKCYVFPSTTEKGYLYITQ